MENVGWLLRGHGLYQQNRPKSRFYTDLQEKGFDGGSYRHFISAR